jgi:hypothetical protein
MFAIAVVILILLMIYFTRKRVPPDSMKRLSQRSAALAIKAQQDGSPIQAVIDANYAAAYMAALKEIATAKEIQSACGIDVSTFESHVLNVQESVTQKVLKQVPDLVGDIDLYLHTISEPGVDWMSSKRNKDVI